MENHDEIDVALLVDGPAVKKWAKDAIDAMIAEPAVTISHIVMNSGGRDIERNLVETARYYLDSIVEYGPWAPVAGLHSKINPPSYVESEDITTADWATDATWIKCSPESYDGLGHALPTEVVDELDSVDVVVRFGFGILQGDILTVPEYGVLSFHHGDIREYRGRPAGVWEFLHGRSTAGVTLQRLTPTLDGGGVVSFREVEIHDASTWQEVHERLLRASQPMLAEAIRAIRDGTFEPEIPEDLGPVYKLPQWKDTLKILYKNVSRTHLMLGSDNEYPDGL